jgi:mRNA-degrading endonuclease RelE of RelBE toxin-antitoxin system
MVTVDYDPEFLRLLGKLDNSIKERVKKQILKIIENPEIGKPMRYTRKDTREVYIPPFRLSYTYIKHEDKIVFFELYHKDEQ